MSVEEAWKKHWKEHLKVCEHDCKDTVKQSDIFYVGFVAGWKAREEAAERFETVKIKCSKCKGIYLTTFPKETSKEEMNKQEKSWLCNGCFMSGGERK